MTNYILIRPYIYIGANIWLMKRVVKLPSPNKLLPGYFNQVIITFNAFNCTKTNISWFSNTNYCLHVLIMTVLMFT